MLKTFRAPRLHRPLMLVACLLTPLPARSQAVQIATAGAWTASGDTTSPVKACGVKADISGGTLLLYARGDLANTLLFALHKAAWRIPNLTVPVTIAFDGGPSFQLVGRGAGATIRADLPAEDVRPFIHHFTADSSATLVLPNGHEPPWRLDLQGTTPTIGAMARCLQAAQIWLPPPFSQSPAATAAMTSSAEPAAPVSPVQPPTAAAQGWVNPDTLPSAEP